MKSLSPIVVSCLLLLTFAAAPLHAQDRNDRFFKANAHYEAGEYEKALDIYETLAQEQLSSEVFYNLANTCFRMGRVGEASLWYRRALFMDPGMIESAQNLRLLRAKLGYLQFDLSGMDKMVAKLSPSSWFLLMTTGAWILILGLAALFMLKFRAPWNAVILALTICGGIVVGLAGTGVYFHRTNLDPAKVAIVVESDVSALSAPVPDGKPVVGLPAGSEVRIRKDRQNWLFVEAPGESAGWVKAQQIVPLWPYSARP